MNHRPQFLGIILFLLFCFTDMALQAQQKESAHAGPPKIPITYTYKIISGFQNTLGYDIYADKKIIIHQPNIPAVRGNEGFKTKMAAEKVAQLMIQKLKKGEMPPTVSITEMQKLKAL